MGLIRLLVLVACTALCLGGSVATAVAAPSEAEATAQQAADHFRAGDFDVAARLFMDAYAKSHRPDAVFNAARAYQNAGKNGDAAGLFRLYISLTDDAAGILEARKHLEALEAGAPPPPAKTQPGSPPVRPMVAASAEAHPSRLGAALTTGGAVVALAGGVALLLVGKSDSHQANVDARRTGDAQAYDSAYGTAQAEWWAGAVLTGAGAVLSGVSIYLWNAPVRVQATGKGVAFSGSF